MAERRISYINMRLKLTSLAFALFFAGHAWGQAGDARNAEEVQNGRNLARTKCAICHIATPDQHYQPVMKPPATSFASIVQQKNFDTKSLTDYMNNHFRKPTHRDPHNPHRMPELELRNNEIEQLVAYFVSLGLHAR